MKHLKYFETFTNKVTIGIDIDGTINNFSESYNKLYKKYFPDKETISTDDFSWYKNMDYNGADPKQWFNNKKAETFSLAQPYPGATESVNNIYEFIKSYGFTLNIVTKQPTQDAKDEAKKWLDNNGFKYDNIIFVEKPSDKWKYSDIMVDNAVDVLDSKPLSKVSIKIEHPYNVEAMTDITIPNIKGLTINVIKQAISKLKNTNVV